MIFEKKIYILIKLDGTKLSNTIISNRLKKFYIRKTNLIKNNTDSLNTIFNSISAEEFWYLISNKNKENKLIKSNN